ncbi:MAG: hypothetical protein AMJ94_18285 [Deltaproteobacteria bacterium SM23_61]|nr:MAG: hypothetical protein AMJ94_18285 [Deltaproteobacteria bacterium SM23_61]
MEPGAGSAGKRLNHRGHRVRRGKKSPISDAPQKEETIKDLSGKGLSGLCLLFGPPAFFLRALCLLFVHPLVFNPLGTKGKDESIFIRQFAFFSLPRKGSATSAYSAVNFFRPRRAQRLL